MAIFDLFSKRQKKQRGEVNDVFTYDNISNHLRVQIVHIVRDTFGKDGYMSRERVKNGYELIHQAFCREYGFFRLGQRYDDSDEEQLINYFLNSNDIDEVIDLIELLFRYIDVVLRDNYEDYKYVTESQMHPDEAITELNERFREHAVGYSFAGGEILRIDSTFIHNEITKPVINLLSGRKWAGANEEFLKAHEHYRHGRNKECLADCLKAFESTLKVICKEKGWSFGQNDTSKKLIQICFQNALVPTFTQNQFTSLQNLFESGIPTIRNKLGGHGQGQIPQKVDDDITRYGLSLTASNIIYLIELSGISK